MENGIGKSVLRVEDQRLLTGTGCFSDDNAEASQAHIFVLRSPYAHAEIKGMDTRAAKAAPGVLTVLTGADYVAEGLGPIPNRPNPPDVKLVNPDGTGAFETPYRPIVIDKVRRIGEAVAVVVAETRTQARDAAELIEVDYAPLPVVTEVEAALAPGAQVLWDEAGGNLSVDHHYGSAEAVAPAFAAAHHVTTIDLHNQRVYGLPLEPRAALGIYDADGPSITLHAGGQGILIQRNALRAIFGLAEENVRVVCKDVGGGFGVRATMFPEFVFTVWASKHVGRPVKWTGEHSEIFLSDPQARDMKTHGELAFDADGRILAMRALTVSNIGAQTLHLVPEARGMAVTTGVYDIPLAHVNLKAVFTNTIPTCVYRGAGRPEAIFVIERLMDKAAVELGVAPDEIRRRNFIPPDAMPYTNPTGTDYDSGTFTENMEMAMEMADWSGFPARKAAATARGRLLGHGMANYIETATGIPPERADIRIDGGGEVEVVLGTQATGQGHETSFAQIVTELLGVPFATIEIHEGDTDRVTMGSGSQSSRSMRVGGTLLYRAAGDIIEKGRRIAAHMLEAAEADLEFDDGQFRVTGTDRAMDLFEVARAAETGAGLADDLKGPLAARQDTTIMIPTFPTGCHICEVEIDPETGALELTRHIAVDDVGVVINPLLVDGQTHGATAQGLGQAMMEHSIYDETGQLLTGTLLDYAIPKAADLPFFEAANNEIFSPNNPLGIKGAGEGGTTGAPPALMNAVVDALSEFGVTHLDMPASSEKIWRAIHGEPG